MKKGIMFSGILVLAAAMWKLSPSPFTPVNNQAEARPSSLPYQEANSPLKRVPAVRPSVRSQNTVTEGAEANALIGSAHGSRGLFTEGLDRFPIDWEIEKFILSLKTSDSTKRLLLSGIVISQQIQEVSPLEFVPLLTKFQDELHANQNGFLEDMKELMGKEKGFPSGFRRGVISIASQLGEVSSPEVQALAYSQIESIKKDSDLNTDAIKNEMIQSLVTYAAMSKDPSAAVLKIRGALDLGDANQLEIYRHAETMIKDRARKEK